MLTPRHRRSRQTTAARAVRVLALDALGLRFFLMAGVAWLPALAAWVDANFRLPTLDSSAVVVSAAVAELRSSAAGYRG